MLFYKNQHVFHSGFIFRHFFYHYKAKFLLYYFFLLLNGILLLGRYRLAKKYQEKHNCGFEDICFHVVFFRFNEAKILFILNRMQFKAIFSLYNIPKLIKAHHTHGFKAFQAMRHVGIGIEFWDVWNSHLNTLGVAMLQ